MISKGALITSVILDIGMLVLSAFAIEMIINASQECRRPITQGFVFAITTVCIVRCSHIFLILILVCAMPCFMCSDSCCLKKRLLKGKVASKKASDALSSNWTW